MRLPSAAAAKGDHITSARIVEEIAGMTYRQLDFWTRRGYVRPNEPEPGSGFARTWTEEEVAVVRRMALLVDGGMVAAAAAEYARRGAGRHEVAPGVVLEVAA